MAPWVRAEVRTFEIGGQPVLLERAEPSAGVFFRAFRPNQATGRWEVDVVVTNGTGRTLRSPLVMRFEMAKSVAPGIQGATLDGEGKPFFPLTPLVGTTGFAPGTALRAFTLSMGDARTRPELAVALYSAPESPVSLPLGVARVLTADGLPAEGTEAEEMGPVTPRRVASGRGGWLSLEAGSGVRGWTFRAPGMEPVVRLSDGLGSGLVTELLTVRQVPVDGGGTTRFPVQALPVPLPRGWSPAGVIRGEAGVREVELLEILPVGREAVWARWDADQLVWKAVERVSGTGLRRVSVNLAQAGIHGLLVPDGGGAGPVVTAVGGVLTGVNGAGVPTGLRAVGVVDPASASASREAARVTARARVEISSTAGALVSGLEVPCEVVEEYRLRDGSRRKLPAYTLRLVAFRPLTDPGTGPLVAEFPVRPFQLLAGEELSEARIRVDVLPPGAFAGGVLRPDGSGLAVGSLRIAAQSGDLVGTEAVLLREPALGAVGDLVPAGVTLVRAFELGVGAVAAGRRLGVDFGTVDPSSSFVLARTVFDAGQHGFQPVLRLVSDAAGKLAVTEPAEGGLPGVDGGGQYLLLKTAGPEAVVEGVARNAAGGTERGLVVRRGPWTALTEADGRYRLLAPSGASELRVLDVVRGDRGTSTVNVGALLAAVQADVGAGQAGPVVLSVSPTNNAVGVARVTPVSVTFSRALNLATVVAGGVQLVDPTGAVVTASVTLNLAGTTVTLLPVNALASATAYRLKVAPTVVDLAGRAVEGARESGFTTVDDTVVRSLAAQVTIYAPGSTNLTPALLGRIPAFDPVRDRDGIVVEGTQGTSEPGRPVVLVNESTGETQTVLADTDGSFVSFVRGSVDDFISAVLVNANGTRNQIPATRQRFDDGTVGLYASGGTIRSTGPGKAVDLIVDPGSVAGKTLFKIESLEPAAFNALAGGKLPEGALPLVGAFELTESGDPLREAADIRLPVKLADMGFPPGALPTNVSFVVVMPIRVDGRVVHQIVDTANYEADGPEGGTLRTASPPFVGMLARKLAQLAKDSGASVVTTPKVASNNDNPHKGETAAFGILPMIVRGPLKVGGFVRAVTRKEDGSETSTPLAGATVRVLQLLDEQDGAPVVFDGDLVSISDERGNFGFFFRPLDSTPTRALVATHPRFPFQRARTGAFAGERQGTTVVNAELLFRELPPELGAVEDISPPRVSVSHTPDLPRAGTGAGNGVDLFVVGVDDRQVGPPSIVVQRVENLRGQLIDAPNALTAGELVADEPARKVRRYRLELPVPGRVVLQASVVDATGKSDIAAHAVSFGVSRPPVVPTDPEDNVALRVIFSWPPDGATNLPALTPIRIRFNRALPESLLTAGTYDWLTFTGGHFVRRVEVDSERRELTVHYDGPTTGAVGFAVGPGITGESGKAFDQDPEEAEQQPFAMGFVQARSVEELLEGNTGAGAALLGRFGYTLEREGSGGRLGVWDFGTPDEPERVRDIRTGYPTAMALIPGYTLPSVSGTAGDCVRENLLAVFTGHANEPKYLQLGRIDGSQIILGGRLLLSGGGSDGEGRPSVAEGVTQAESLSQIVKAKWDPPYLGYFELGADVTSVKLINLHAFRRVEQRGGRLDGFTQGTDGTDANGDGDFCDAGDVVPSPDRSPLTPPGMAFSFAPAKATERFDDFDFHAGLGLVVSVGRFLDATNAPRFTTLLAASDPKPLTNAFVSFPSGETLRRVLLLPATTVDNGTNLVSRDLALVSISRGSGAGALAIIDLTTPSAPVLTNRFDLPSGEGPAGSAQLRSDGLLAVASGRSTLLYDPRKLLRPAVGGESPALVGRIDGTGTGVRDFVSDPTGIQLTFGGANRRYVETAPRFSFVRFNALINPEQVAAQDPTLATGFLRSATPVAVADVMPAGNGTNAPAMDPAKHYYVLMDAPGGAADGSGRLPLVLSAVDTTGMPQVERGGTPVPAVVGDEQLYSALLAQRTINLVLGTISVKKALTSVTEATGVVDRAKAVFKLAKSAKKLLPKLKSLGLALKLLPDKFVARRLSDDPNHPLYNRFLAGPFVVLGGSPSVEQLTALNEQAAAREITRVYLRPSARLWVGLPSERAESLVSFPDPFKPSPSRLPTFVSELRLNPTFSVFGMKIPQSGKVIEEMAQINQLPSNPLSPFDLGEQVTLIVSLISEVPVVGKVLKGDWKPMLMPGAHALLRVNYTERPMVLVPGFAASKLEIDGVNHWLGFPQTASELAASVGAIFGTNTKIPALDRARKDLRIQPDGTPVRETFATDMLRFALQVPTEAGSIYGDWVNHLTGEMGFVEYKFQGTGVSAAGPQVRDRLRLGGKPGLGQAPSPNLFVFPYDWRLDNQKAAEALREYVRLALEMHPDADGVDLVGHSNGGLVSRAYLLMPGQRARVKRFITVGTPWLGSPKPLSGLKSGNLDDMAIGALAPIPAVRKMLQFSPGAHQLLPSREYFALGFRPLVEDGFDVNTNGLPNESFDFDGFQEVLARHFLRGPAEELLNETGASSSVPTPRRSVEDLPGGEHPVRRNANAFRGTQAIGDHRGDPDDVEMHHIVGFGATPDTIGQLRIRGRLVPRTAETNVAVSVARVSAFDSEQVTDGPALLIHPADGKLAVNPTNQFRMNEEVELRYVAGDGTVPIASLARGFGSGASLNAANARVYALVGGRGQDVTGHNPMLNTEEFLQIFDTVYNGREVETIRVTAVAAGGFSEGSPGTLNVAGVMPGGIAGSISYVADFGDGAVELRKDAGGTSTFQHQYRQSGTYLVTVGASAKLGESTVYGISSVQITVANEPPQVKIEGGDFTVNRGETRVLVATVTDAGLDDRHRFDWELPPGNRSGPGTFATPVTFDEPGTETVQVVVTDSDGGTGTASIRVTVRSEAPSLAGSSFGADPAVRRSAREANIPGFEGGHPEIMVRFHGHAPDELDTVGISVSQVGTGTELAGLVFDRLFGRAGAAALNLLAVIERALSPQVAQFLGKMAAEGGSDYARMMRQLPLEAVGVDLAAKKALLAVRGKDGPVEVDLLYLEGGLAKVLHRWAVTNVPAGEGLRLTFDWDGPEGILERVTPDAVTGSPLNGTVIATLPVLFSAFGEQRSGDRVGPSVAGILNPALDRVTVLARDNLTTETNILLFAVFDANENGRLDDDTFYPLDTNVVDFARLPKRPFAVVGIDEHGNVGSLDPFRVTETRNFLGVREAGEDRTTYEQRLIAIRSAVRQVITNARDSAVIKGRFLLDPADLWVFEQGSGANLWKTNFVSRCNGIYIPGKSDNDYELFLPVHLEVPFGQGEADRLRFEAAGPHSRSMLEGDWYFKRPIGVDADGNPTRDDGQVAQWEYALPAGKTVDGQTSFRVARRETDDNIAAGFRSPLTPAEVIAREFVRTVKSDPAVRKLLPDTSFFPERREHFMFGRLHLQRPPEFGDDPIGDAGTGRQMLMLKWLLEGAYVTASDGGGAGDFSSGAPELVQIYARWKTVGVPRVEGHEWGVFQDYAALKAKPFQLAEMRTGTEGRDQRLRLMQRSIDDAVAQQQAARLKKLGKAAIRATLARLAGDTNLNAIVTSVPDLRVTDGSVRSFEHVIRELVLGSAAAKEAFGDFAKDRDDVTEPPDIGDFLRAKNGDREYLATILHEPGAYERFIRTTFVFLRTVVQRPTLSPYRDYMGGLRVGGFVDELEQRTSNMNFVLRGDGGRLPGLLALNADRRIARMTLPLSVEVYGPGVDGGVKVRRQGGDAGGGPGAGRRNATPALDGEATETQQLAADADSDNTIDGTEEGEPLFAEEGSAEQDRVDPAFAVTVAQGEPVSADNDVAAPAERMSGAIPAPAISDRPEVFLGISPVGRDPVFLLTDHPGDGFRFRSPRHVLRTTDRLAVMVVGPVGAGTFEASVQMAGSSVDPQRIRLTDSDGLGLYTNEGPANRLRFTNRSPAPAGEIYVRDEDVLVVRVTGPGLATAVVFEVMIDLGEFAMATVQHADRDLAVKPRFDYQQMFVLEPRRIDWASAGVGLFPDDVAKAAFDAGVPGGDNAMRRFLQAYSDPTRPETGEADVMYVHTHGSPAGQFIDHINEAAAGTGRRKLVLDPEVHLAADGRWDSDADWFISEACALLFGGLGGPPQPPGSTAVGAVRWRDTLRASARPPHGILGFAFGKTANRTATTDFLIRLDVGLGYVEAWKAACENANPALPWAALHYRSASRDTVREMSADPLPGDAQVYDSFVGVPQGLCIDGPECCSGPGVLTALEAGLWVKTDLLGKSLPTDLPAGLIAGKREFLRAGAVQGRRVTRTAGWEEMSAGADGKLISFNGADDGDGARRAAESFLATECGIEASLLRWNYTGEAIRQVFHGNGTTEPAVMARVVNYEWAAHGLPVRGSGVTVKVQPEGISRVTIQRAALPVRPAGDTRIRPVSLEEVLGRHWTSPARTAAGGRVVLAAKLCWSVDTSGMAVPAWEIQWATADPAGVPAGVPETLWLDAAQGRLMEVSK